MTNRAPAAASAGSSVSMMNRDARKSGVTSSNARPVRAIADSSSGRQRSPGGDPVVHPQVQALVVDHRLQHHPEPADPVGVFPAVTDEDGGGSRTGHVSLTASPVTARHPGLAAQRPPCPPRPAATIRAHLLTGHACEPRGKGIPRTPAAVVDTVPTAAGAAATVHQETPTIAGDTGPAKPTREAPRHTDRSYRGLFSVDTSEGPRPRSAGSARSVVPRRLGVPVLEDEWRGDRRCVHEPHPRHHGRLRPLRLPHGLHVRGNPLIGDCGRRPRLPGLAAPAR